MKRTGRFLLIASGVVVLLIAGFYIDVGRPINDGRTPAERRQIADACFAIVHSSLTNEVDEIKMDDPRIPVVIRALHPHHIEVIQNFAVEIYRTEWPQEYFLMRLQHPTNTWILCVAGPSMRFGGGGREILRIEQLTMRCREPGMNAAAAIQASGGPGRRALIVSPPCAP